MRLQQEDKIAPEMIAQLATEPIMENYISHRCVRLQNRKQGAAVFGPLYSPLSFCHTSLGQFSM